MIRQLGVVIVLASTGSIVCMSSNSRAFQNQTFVQATTPAHVEQSVRRRLFAIDDQAKTSSGLQARKICYKDSAAIVTGSENEENGENGTAPCVIPSDPESKIIYSENGRYLLVSRSESTLSTLKTVKIYDARTGKEEFSYCGNFRHIADMKLTSDAVGYNLIIVGTDFMTGKPKYGTYAIDLGTLEHIARAVSEELD